MTAPPRLLPPSAGDLAAAAVATALVGLSMATDAVGSDPHTRGLDVFAWMLLAVAMGVAWSWRRRPAAAALGALAAAMVWYVVGYDSPLIRIPVLVSFYLVGATGNRRLELVVVSIAATAVATAMVLTTDESVAASAAGGAWTIAAILLGEVTFNRRMLLAEYAERVRRAEVERDAVAERRVADARLEIARDLHDVLAHTVTVMTVKAAVGQDALKRGADGAADALQTIRAAGREATKEIRALVAVLRDGNETVGTAPVPRLNRLADLAAATERAGVPVALDVCLDDAELSEVEELTAYRIVQESLTNVVRHAAATAATVRVLVDGARLIIDVRNDGADRSSPAPHSSGFGLHGMRERAETLGGHLQAGPGGDGTWRVTARIPLERAVR